MESFELKYLAPKFYIYMSYQNGFNFLGVDDVAVKNGLEFQIYPRKVKRNPGLTCKL